MLLLLLACDSVTPTTGEVGTVDLHCGQDLLTAAGHLEPAVVTSLSMCWPDDVVGELCDMTPAPMTIIYRPRWGYVADCTDYGPDAWMRVHHLIAR
jgi:hypothetical protein